MSTTPGKVHILGVQTIRHSKIFVLDFLQACGPSLVERPSFAKFDPDVTWFDVLRPTFRREHFFFESSPASQLDLAAS